MKILIVPTHPGVQYHFCRVGVPIHFLGCWEQFKYWRPKPDNVVNVLPSFDEAHLEYGPEDYARLLDDPNIGWPDRYDSAWLMFNWQVKLFWERPGKKLFRVAKVAELERDQWARLLDRDDFTVVSFYPNTVAWLKETFDVDVPYVPLGLDPSAYGPATGEDGNILSIIHSYHDRGWHHDAWREATARPARRCTSIISTLRSPCSSTKICSAHCVAHASTCTTASRSTRSPSSRR